MRNRPFPSTLTDAFDAAAASFGDRVAVDDLTHSLTYGELAGRVDRLARALRAQGTGEEEPVGLCAARSVDLIVGLLAILKAGCAYVPMPPDYPVERLRTMADQIQLRHIVADPQSAEIAHTLAGQVLEVGTEIGPPADGEPTVRADGLAYVMFTSGSSGTPKGVMIEHANVISLLNGCDQLFEIDEHDIWAMIHSYAFDFSVWEIWGALAYGGRLLIVPREVVRSPESLWDVCVRRGVTMLSVTPSYFAQVSAAAQHSADPEGALRYVVFGGEALPMATLGPWYRRFPAASPHLVNMYGITETTVHSTAQFLDESFVNHQASVVGRPLPHLDIHLLDSEQRPVADGEVGEIYVSGGGVARGYHGRPDLTSERFTTIASIGRRTYRSGDLARRAADGSLEYIGRADAQVKVRGFRVEPGEIEACILGYPGMRQVVVVPRQGDPDGRLVAYFVADDEIDIPALRSFIGGRLPEFMVPAFFRRVSSFQLTVNGKVDRRALPQTEQLDTGDGAGDPPALDGVAAKLAAIWGQVLGLPTVGVDQDFFTVGGDSMTAIKVVRSCRAEGVNLKVADLYQHPTIRDLTEILYAGVRG